MSLAIIAPQIGALSETFIRKHMEDLWPNNTVVLAGTASLPYAGHWNINCPKLVIDQLNIIDQLCMKIQRKFLPENLKLVRKVEHFILESNVKTILAEYLDSSVHWLPLALKLDIPFFVHAHGIDVSRRLRQKKWQSEYLKYNQSSGVIVVNQVMRQRLINLGISSQKIHVIPSGVNVPSSPVSKSLQSDIVRCLAVGRMVPKKAPLLTLDAFHQASKIYPNLHLDYVGSGPLLENARQFVQDYNLGEKVTFHGGQPHQFVQQLMRQANIFLQHSVTDSITGDEEGMPVGILEAMASSLPVISTFHAGIPEAIDDGKTGLLLNEGDVKKMADCIVILARDPQLRLQIGHNAWEEALKRFSWEIESKKLRQLMRLDECRN